jgi:asparagine synthase (glutamine-hydrolysing)
LDLNGIFGLFNLDGAPVNTEQLTTMQEALAFWAVDGANQWSAGQIGMGCLHQPSTPEAIGEQLPVHDEASGLTLTAGARLDNRAELLNKLKIEANQAQVAGTDGEIILRAYQQWGRDCVLRLEGDWHFAVWDERARTLFMARDHHGNTGLYYYRGSRTFAFASSKKALLALDSVPKAPDLLRISQVLVAWPGNGVRTGYEQIYRLPPAHHMTVTADRATTERYWFPENVSPLYLKSDDDYVDAFLEVFTRAVSARLHSQRPVGVTLSGGLDSGSVMAIAARLEQERSERLIAFTSTPLSDPDSYTDRRRMGDERQLAQATARYAGSVDHHLVRSESVSPLTGIERMLWVHDEPGHAAANQFWITALLEAARQREVGALLTGQMGNATISWAGAGENLLPMLLDGDIAAFRQAFETARRGASLGRWRGVRRFLLKPLLWPFWVQIQKRWRPRREPWREYSAIRSDFARSIELSRKMAQTEYVPGLRPSDPLQQRLRIVQPGQTVLGAIWLESGAAYGLEVRDPTQDRQLIELCLAIPEAQFQRNGLDRWLIRRAMQGYLPDAVRLNTRRGLQAADLGQRVLENRGEVEAALAALARHDLAGQVLDLPRMENVLASMQHNLTPKNTAECSAILLRALMVGLFLLRF